MARLKLGVLVSGRGSNLQALIDACRDPAFPAEIAVVISNRADAQAIARAEAAGIATAVIPHRQFASRADFDAAVDARLRQAEVALVCLAGFMRLLTTGFVAAWFDRMINIHPSLLPSFKGLHPQQQAIDAGVRLSGCTVHYVRDEMDAGPIIVQAMVPVLPDDDESRLADRILTAEHAAYPLAVRLIADGRVTVSGERTLVSGGGWPAAPVLVPTAA
ncbi:formyltetrahydrofolate-dependent phosphoribosylglycinamide formyltransferase [Stella humosa]|uniref:Phosphoribosylglycinamide formyltransferase n=1 Tax=Stella humosa TaxID=94 RepID=A0A3N1M9Y9_9PROT|nr:phosphoribosylglycinamide formyltransferase [Stella humosa]ROP99506.1 formyltetrahydrofolate-dependent phosphoribosylglycinamide formyltransferase [Stella humosa]BBK31280.1 phosphoribosylglycinamide formyltransferase [Stella humosa]